MTYEDDVTAVMHGRPHMNSGQVAWFGMHVEVLRSEARSLDHTIPFPSWAVFYVARFLRHGNARELVVTLSS